MKGHPAPCHKPADEKNDEQVQAPAPHPAAVPPQGDVEIVPEPGRQGYVPPPPELCRRVGEIGAPEIFHEGESHDLGRTDGNERVAGKITVDLV